jgi:filamentous hemagglutinin
LQSLPGVPIGNANLIAPRGTVNAGAAGIRVSGDLNIAALFVLNSYNIQVQGVTTGLPVVQGPPVTALTEGNNQSAAVKPTAPVAQDNGDRPSIIIVEFLGFGGGDDGEDREQRDDKHRQCDGKDRQCDGKESLRQDPNSAVQILGAGNLNEQAKQYLTADERSRLSDH